MDDIYWLGFSVFVGIGPLRFQKLLKSFKSAKDAWFANESDLAEVLGKKLASQFLEFRKNFTPEKYVQQLGQKKISYVLLKNKEYPQLLKVIPNAPFVLYVKGDKELVSQATKTLAVVGTRKVTQYGTDVTTALTRDLAAQGFTIVSGLAMGVDAVAHQAAIESGGKTIAVLGCGVDCCSPRNNLTIYDKIIEQFGAVVSETAFGQATSKGMFPSRNRIIAGLSLGVLVTEGAVDSGALITAQRALEIERPVFAVPGPITSTLSGGTNHLLSKGGILVRSADDILISLNITNSAKQNMNCKEIIKADSPEEQQIIDILQQESLYFDEIVRNIQRDPSIISSILSMMEIKGMIRSNGGKFSL